MAATKEKTPKVIYEQQDARSYLLATLPKERHDNLTVVPLGGGSFRCNWLTPDIQPGDQITITTFRMRQTKYIRCYLGDDGKFVVRIPERQ